MVKLLAPIEISTLLGTPERTKNEVSKTADSEKSTFGKSKTN